MIPGAHMLGRLLIAVMMGLAVTAILALAGYGWVVIIFAYWFTSTVALTGGIIHDLMRQNRAQVCRGGASAIGTAKAMEANAPFRPKNCAGSTIQKPTPSATGAVRGPCPAESLSG